MKKSFFSTWCVSCFLYFSIAMFSLPIADAKTIKLKIGHGNPTVHHIHRAMEEWAAKIEQQTNNKVEFKVYPVGTLCSPMEIYEGVAVGLMDFGFAPDGYTAARFPLNVGVATFMLGLKSALIGSKICMELYKEFPELREEFKDTHVLWLNVHSGADIHTKTPVRTLADLKNMQIRTPPGIPPSVQAMGAVPVAMPMPETYEALQKNIVQGYVGTSETLKAFRLADVTKFTTEIRFYSGAFFMVANRKTWNSLPDDVKSVIESMNGWGLEALADGWDSGDKNGKEFAEKMGHEFITPSDDMLSQIYSEIKQKAQQPWINKMESNGKPGKRIMDRLNELMEQYNK